jgi:predicted acetyltransferase
MSVVKLLADEDFEEYARLSLEAYPAMFTEMSDERKSDWIKRMQEQQKLNVGIQYAGAWRDEKLVGTMRLHSFDMNVHGVVIPAGGVGNVAVDLRRKKEHVAKELMEHYHKLYRDSGAPMALLWPFRPDFYRNMGYGYGRKMNKYAMKTDDLPRGSKTGVDYLGEGDIDTMLECFNRYARANHGMILKKRPFFERLIQRYKVVGYRKDGKVEGFIAIKFKKINPNHFLLQNIEVEYLIYENRDALSGLLAFLQTQLDQVERVVFLTMDDDLHFIPHDPRNGEAHIFQTSQESNVQAVGMMYRVINKELLFKKLSDHSFNGVELKVKFNVADSFLPENDGSVVIHFMEGKPLLGKPGYDVEVSIPVEWFSSLIMGVIDFEKLWMYGHVEVSDESYVETLDTLFHVAKKPETTEEF